MGGPVWLTGIFAAMMVTVAAYCTGRLVTARGWRRPTEVDADAGHVLMGVAMAGMLVTGLRVMPAGIWEAVFAAGAAWFGWQMLRTRLGAPTSPWRCPHPAPHLVECAAMLYMFMPPSIAGRGAAPGMAAMSASATESRFSFLALLMALFMFGYVVRVADRLTARAPAVAVPSVGRGPAARADSPPEDAPLLSGYASPGSRLACAHLAPRCAALCKIAMGITMGYMLILML